MQPAADIDVTESARGGLGLWRRCPGGGHSAAGLRALAEAGSQVSSPAYSLGAFGNFGKVVFSEDHFTGAASAGGATEGDHLASVAAGRYQRERRTYTGETYSTELRAGSVIALTNAYDPSDDQEYLVTAVSYTFGYDVDADLQTYRLSSVRPFKASFHAIPFKVPFRPERRARWPRIDGVLRGDFTDPGGAPAGRGSTASSAATSPIPASSTGTSEATRSSRDQVR